MAKAMERRDNEEDEVSLEGSSKKENGDDLPNEGTFEYLLEFVLKQKPELIPVFLITFRDFALPPQLLNHLKKIYEKNKSNTVVIERLFTFLTEWIDEYFLLDIKKKMLVNELLEFVDVAFPKRANHFKLLIVNKNKEAGIKNGSIAPSPSSSKTVVPSFRPKLESKHRKRSNTRDDTLFKRSREELIAEQLTLLDFEILEKVQLTEFLGKAWQKKDKEIQAPNLTMLAKHFNDVSNWVSTEILSTESNKARLSSIVRFIKVAKVLFKLNNFNGVMQVLSGLNNFSVLRLKNLWEALPVKAYETFQKLEGYMSHEMNYKRYRTGVKKALDKKEKVLPYVALLLRDVTFMYDGNADYVEGNLINFGKMLLLGNCLIEFLGYQRIAWGTFFQRDEQLIEDIISHRFLSDNTLGRMSNSIEPSRTLGVIEEDSRSEFSESEIRVEKVQNADLSTNPQEWKEAHVITWLHANGLGSYSSIFKDISGLQLFSLSQNDLLSMGIDKLGHRKQIQKHINALRERVLLAAYGLEGPTGSLSRNPSEWSTQEVAKWVSDLGDLNEFIPVFEKNKVDGKCLLALTDQLLREKGVDKVGPRKRLLKAISGLKSDMQTNFEIYDKPVHQWAENDVCAWLKLGGLEEYCSAFQSNTITGSELLDLKEKDLIDLKVSKLGHRKKLAKAILQMRTSTFSMEQWKSVGIVSDGASSYTSYSCPGTPNGSQSPSLSPKTSFYGSSMSSPHSPHVPPLLTAALGASSPSNSLASPSMSVGSFSSFSCSEDFDMGSSFSHMTVPAVHTRRSSFSSSSSPATYTLWKRIHQGLPVEFECHINGLVKVISVEIARSVDGEGSKGEKSSREESRSDGGKVDEENDLSDDDSSIDTDEEDQGQGMMKGCYRRVKKQIQEKLATHFSSMRYRDQDGDLVLIRNDGDVIAMAKYLRCSGPITLVLST